MTSYNDHAEVTDLIENLDNASKGLRQALQNRGVNLTSSLQDLKTAATKLAITMHGLPKKLQVTYLLMIQDDPVVMAAWSFFLKNKSLFASDQPLPNDERLYQKNFLDEVREGGAPQTDHVPTPENPGALISHKIMGSTPQHARRLTPGPSSGRGRGSEAEDQPGGPQVTNVRPELINDEESLRRNSSLGSEGLQRGRWDLLRTSATPLGVTRHSTPTQSSNDGPRQPRRDLGSLEPARRSEPQQDFSIDTVHGRANSQPLDRISQFRSPSNKSNRLEIQDADNVAQKIKRLPPQMPSVEEEDEGRVDSNAEHERAVNQGQTYSGSEAASLVTGSVFKDGQTGKSSRQATDGEQARNIVSMAQATLPPQTIQLQQTAANLNFMRMPTISMKQPYDPNDGHEIARVINEFWSAVINLRSLTGLSKDTKERDTDKKLPRCNVPVSVLLGRQTYRNGSTDVPICCGECTKCPPDSPECDATYKIVPNPNGSVKRPFSSRACSRCNRLHQKCSRPFFMGICNKSTHKHQDLGTTQIFCESPPVEDEEEQLITYFEDLWQAELGKAAGIKVADDRDRDERNSTDENEGTEVDNAPGEQNNQYLAGVGNQLDAADTVERFWDLSGAGGEVEERYLPDEVDGLGAGKKRSRNSSAPVDEPPAKRKVNMTGQHTGLQRRPLPKPQRRHAPESLYKPGLGRADNNAERPEGGPNRDPLVVISEVMDQEVDDQLHTFILEDSKNGDGVDDNATPHTATAPTLGQLLKIVNQDRARNAAIFSDIEQRLSKIEKQLDVAPELALTVGVMRTETSRGMTTITKMIENLTTTTASLSEVVNKLLITPPSNFYPTASGQDYSNLYQTLNLHEGSNWPLNIPTGGGVGADAGPSQSSLAATMVRM